MFTYINLLLFCFLHYVHVADPFISFNLFIFCNVLQFYCKNSFTEWIQLFFPCASLFCPFNFSLFYLCLQVAAPRWRASPAAWRRPWIQGTWSRTPSITSPQPISSTPSSPRWSGAGGRPCPAATVTSAPAETTRKPCCSALTTSSDLKLAFLLSSVLKYCQPCEMIRAGYERWSFSLDYSESSDLHFKMDCCSREMRKCLMKFELLIQKWRSCSCYR